MINGKKIIGICMTKMDNTTRARTTQFIYEEARRLGYGVIIFNNTFDFDNKSEVTETAEGIYDFINFDIVDGLIILCSGFLKKSVYRKIADRAAAHNIPVVLEDEIYGNCVTVKNSFEDTFEKLLNHVVRDHGVRDTYFIAGNKGNEYSERRIEVYKKVLAENDIDFSEDMIGYGDFWHGPTYALIDSMMKSGKKLPEAIFCANDAMAIAACEKLGKYGVKVPDDVIITGLDGSKLAEFTMPKLSTCSVDLKGFAEKSVKALDNVFNGISNESVCHNYYSLRLAASCGCKEENNTDFRKTAEENYHTIIDLIGHEHYVFDRMLSIMNTDAFNMNAFYGAISSIMHESSLFALNPLFFIRNEIEHQKPSALSEKLVSITPDKLFVWEAKSRKSFSASDMIPEKERWANSNFMYVINQVHIGKSICGYYECVTDDLNSSAQIINRVLNLVNMIFHMAVSDLDQRISKLERGREALIDPITELANLHGATHWFEDFCEKNENRIMTVSLYEIPKYRYIYEEYGLKETEAMLCFIAEALKISNPHNCFIARASENEFITVNWYKNEEDVTPVINSATTAFYQLLRQYNMTNGKEYYTEVNAGCSSVGDQKLETFIFDATNALYRNKLIYGTRTAVKSEMMTSKEKYDLFNSLIYNNLFLYHFQPIVSAETGDIYAYEALMRTDSTIGFNPMEVISIAAEYQRLYDIEKATLFNVMERYKNDKESFGDAKVFINCIPGHFLNDDDGRKLSEKYSEYIDNFVFEITEQNTINERELDTIRKLANPYGNNPIAVDDYGTGHSNVVNLITYSPEIVKIDRFLMTDIHKDETKQLFVQSVIDFARLNNIKVLAEGIETADELRKVVEMGVDFIQGYYTARPAFEPIKAVSPDVKAVITEAYDKRVIKQRMREDELHREDDKLMSIVGKLKASGISTEQIIEKIMSI